MGPYPPCHGPAHIPPTARRAKYPRRPRRVASERAPTLALAHNGPTLVGARVPRARRHPTPARGSVVGRPAASAPGTGRRGRRPLPFSHPHPLGPDDGPTTARRAKYPRRPRRVASERLRPGQMVATGGTQFSASVHTGAPPPGTTRRSGKWTATPPRTWGARREISVRNKISSMARIVI